MKKKTTKKEPSKKSSAKSKQNTEKMLIENFVSLQKVMTDLSFKFNNLTNQISNLLELFETSAKTLAQKDFNFDLETLESSNERFEEKLDNLLDQNKVIARGLTLIHENSSNMMQQNFQPPSEPSPEFQEPLQRQEIQNNFLPSGKNLNNNYETLR